MQETWDILCLLLMIRINYHHQLIMNKRRIPCLDDYLDRINLTLWPRFKVRPTTSKPICCFTVLYTLSEYDLASISHDECLTLSVNVLRMYVAMPSFHL